MIPRGIVFKKKFRKVANYFYEISPLFPASFCWRNRYQNSLRGLEELSEETRQKQILIFNF